MTGGWADDGWVEDLESWEEIRDLLRCDWDQISCPSLGLSLERADGLLAFDMRGHWRARHRRGLHRLGFRRLALPRLDVWLWTAEPTLRATDLDSLGGHVAVLDGEELSATAAAVVERLRTSFARDHLIREQALRVLREVFRCEPEDLGVLLAHEDESWGDEEEDDVWPLPGA